MSGRRSKDYTRCPVCDRRTVILRQRQRDARGAYLICVRCRWDVDRRPAFWDSEGLRDVRRWRAINGLDDDTDDTRRTP